MMKRLVLALVGLGVMGASAARAEWMEARSRHFILYGDTSEKSLRAQAVALERLDQSLRFFLKKDDTAESASNPLTVFITRDSDVRKFSGNPAAAGLYRARVGGSVAFSAGFDGSSNFPRIVLFHEYTHHFIAESYPLAFPSWFSEGVAEFASTMRLESDRAVIGIPAQHRAYGLFAAPKIPVQSMLDPATWARLQWADQADAFYGRGWLLTHYLFFHEGRFAQFSRYVALLNAGRPPLKAAEEGFGDLRALNHEVEGYLGGRRIPGMYLPFRDKAEPQVTLRPLLPGEAAMIRLRMESTNGVDQKTAKSLYERAAPIAARFPDDPVAQGWFAEIAHDAGEIEAGQKAADLVLVRDPKSVQGLLYKARLRIRELVRDKVHDPAAWQAARSTIIAANRLDPNNAEPLWEFWKSFAAQGVPPVKSAFTGLYRAQELTPQDDDVRYAAAVARVQAGEEDWARALLRPLAYDPHAKGDNPAARMLAALDAGLKGNAVLAAAEGAPVLNDTGSGTSPK
ncbi:hypothetical protein [uncultured Sphingomonas sp.]|uniref:hypothetical protein n=1 Tax=uncultured Sphingomonas sp. TaxID=158754 RepID=UPI00261C3DF2|nr:hypothetical protein [uncultured Sphingomonas sp.]